MLSYLQIGQVVLTRILYQSFTHILVLSIGPKIHYYLQTEGEREVEVHCKDSVNISISYHYVSEGDGEVEATSHCKDSLSDWLSPSTYQYLTIMCGDRI